MTELQKKYEELVEKRNLVIKRMNKLEENESVKEYINLEKNLINLNLRRQSLIISLIEENYDNCH